MPTYDVLDWVDVLHVQKRTQSFAEELGFLKRERSELAIVASELASNILKYGVRGTLEMDRFADARGAGIMMIASDRGPQFHDLDAALKDGWSDRGPIDPLDMLKRKGIGGGLGAICRLTHSFRVEPLPRGKRVHVVRYLIKRSTRPPRRSRRPGKSR
jgi:anti-sigma regulatory factor (Ser/Thr protein kinase)